MKEKLRFSCCLSVGNCCTECNYCCSISSNDDSASINPTTSNYPNGWLRSVTSWIEFNKSLISAFLNKTTMFMLAPSVILYSIYIMYMFHYRRHHEYTVRETLWVSSAGFVFLTVPISVRLIYLHLSHWVQPRVQKYIVRIIWMIPVYSIESWLALRFGSYTLIMQTLRECYEAYAIYNFVHFLFSLLGEETNLAAILKEKPANRGIHKFPMSLFTSSWVMGQDFLFKCKLGVFQYIVLKSVTAVLTFLLASMRLYGEGTWRFDRGYMYVFLIDSTSQLWALYCMIMFYTAAKEELTPWRPVGKFLCVKMVVFFTWWQAIGLNIAMNSTNLTSPHLSKAVQNFLICIEMFIASLAFTNAFSHHDYLSFTKTKLEDPVAGSNDEMKHPVLSALQSTLNLSDDIFADLRRATRWQQLVSNVESVSESLNNSLQNSTNCESFKLSQGNKITKKASRIGKSLRGIVQILSFGSLTDALSDIDQSPSKNESLPEKNCASSEDLTPLLIDFSSAGGKGDTENIKNDAGTARRGSLKILGDGNSEMTDDSTARQENTSELTL